MTNEEFQKIVLKKLENLENNQAEMKKDISEIKVEQAEMKKDIKGIIEQTADLTEFRHEMNENFDKLSTELNTMEIVTSKNWNDIAKLKAAR